MTEVLGPAFLSSPFIFLCLLISTKGLFQSLKGDRIEPKGVDRLQSLDSFQVFMEP